MYEEIAEAIRKAYGEAEKDTNPRMLYHIQEQPWETLPDHRKYKWIEMAKAAAQIYRNHGLGIDF